MSEFLENVELHQLTEDIGELMTFTNMTIFAENRYFVSRGKILSKVAKYPHIIDYRRAVQEMDEKEYTSLWLVMSEVRNRYCSLHDLVIKNLEKIKRPRSSNAESLY